MSLARHLLPMPSTSNEIIAHEGVNMGTVVEFTTRLKRHGSSMWKCVLVESMYGECGDDDLNAMMAVRDDLKRFKKCISYIKKIVFVF